MNIYNKAAKEIWKLSGKKNAANGAIMRYKKLTIF